MSVAKLIASITLRIATWAVFRKEFSNFSLIDILVNLEGCMGCGPTKVSSLVFWSLPPLNVLNFNVDGAAKGKLEPVGIGGVLRNGKGDVLLIFYKYVGVCDSNKEEVLAILEALWCFL